jgi:hypothetical protein
VLDSFTRALPGPAASGRGGARGQGGGVRAGAGGEQGLSSPLRLRRVGAC